MARGSIVKRPSGNYAIVYYVDGKQKWETVGTSRREAERALTARKREVDTGTWREPSSETLATYAERWLERRNPARVSGAGRTRLAPSTFEGYRLNMRRHVLPRLGTRTLSSLRTEDVDRLIAELESEGKAPGTVRNVVVPLRKMLADAVRQGLILASPAARADLPPAQDFAGKEIPAAHTDAIRSALLELAPDDPLRNERDLFYVRFFDVALGTSPWRVASAALARRRPRAPTDSRRAGLLASGAPATEDRIRNPLRTTVPFGGGRVSGAGSAGGRARAVCTRGARLRVDPWDAVPAIELPAAGLAHRAATRRTGR
jgi:Phage integrase, N-terminal SAM-like domain